MNKKTATSLSRIILTSFVMLLGIAAVSSATDIIWDNGAGDYNWNNPLNWIGHAVPGTGNNQYARIQTTAGPVFSPGRTATAYRVYLEGTNGTITMSGGTLNTISHIYMAAVSTDTATLNMSSGDVNIGGASRNLYCGQNGTATLNMSGGDINISGTFNVALNNGSNGTVNLSGGTITTASCVVSASGIADVNLSGGTIDCSALSMRTSGGTGTINITSGTLIITNAGAANVNTYITNGWIKAYNGVGTVLVDVDNINPGKTTVWAEISNKATIPIPASGATNVPVRETNLRWKAGVTAASHDVYFGTVLNDVNNAQRLLGDLNGDGTVDKNDMLLLAGYWLEDPAGTEPYAGVNDDNIVDFFDYALLAQDWMNSANPVFKGNHDANSFSPGTLALSTTYYWRIDEVNGPNTFKGDTWSFTTAAVDSNYSLVGKIMCGYQGWFNTPTDGAGRGWVHWGPGSFSPTSCTVDMWPDMTEYDASEKFLASAFYDGNNYYVFSPYKLDTVLRHFQWMQDYGIDGVYLQRFATEVTPGSAEFLDRNAVLSHCKDGANLYGKKYAVMYDLSGLNAGQTTKVINDWKYLVDTIHIGRDANDLGYMFHNGRPVVALWGFGFGRAYEGQESYDLINFFKNDPCYGGNVVMLGVNDTWRSGASVETRTLLLADIISPWWVGRYANTAGAYNFASSKGVPDKAWCDTNGKEYLPVMFPGFSFHNANPAKPFNEIPRAGGQFLWDQVYADITTIGANMLYLAMFDEVDEATAIFKVTNNPPRPGGVDMFVTYDIDGYPLPSDEYLWLTGKASQGLRGEIPVTSTRPVR